MCQRIKIKNCIYCSESFEAKRKNHCYCSASCRVMACYKRKGYTYVSGHYQKPNPTLNEEMQASDSVTVTPVSPKMPPATPMNKSESAGRSADSISAMAIAENALGSGLVATAKYLMYDKPLMEMIKELHEILVAQPRRILQQQTMQMGMGMQPMPMPTAPTTSQQLNTKHLGIDANPFNGGMMMGT